MTEQLKKILYAEDEADVAEVTIMTLEELGGFEVKHCINGQQVLDSLQSFQPQLILLDVMMPIMDGVKTINILKSKPETSSIPVVFLTAKSQKHEQHEYAKMGAVGVILKPCDPPSLCMAIDAMWEESKL